MCITNIRQRNLQPTRVTEQRSLKHSWKGIQGLKQANMAALKLISLYPQCTDSKECLCLVGPLHTLGRVTVIHQIGEARFCGGIFCIPIQGRSQSLLCKHLQLTL